MKRIILAITIMLLLVTSVTSAFAGTMNVQVNSADATVDIIMNSADYSNFKVIVEKDDVEYIYNLVSKVETLPLQLGSGLYTISILGSNDGRRYRLISKDSFNVQLEENAVFLSSSQTVNWNDDSK